MGKNRWFYVAILSIIASIASLFTPIITYESEEGMVYKYTVIELIEGEDFTNTVLCRYTGPVLWDITGSIVTGLMILTVISLICAVIAIFTLRAQYPGTWNFVLAFAGLVGIMLPVVLVIVAVVLSDKYFRGTISCGAAPAIIVTAMIVSMLAVTQRKNKVIEQCRKEAEAKKLLRKAGDL